MGQGISQIILWQRPEGPISGLCKGFIQIVPIDGFQGNKKGEEPGLTRQKDTRQPFLGPHKGGFWTPRGNFFIQRAKAGKKLNWGHRGSWEGAWPAKVPWNHLKPRKTFGQAKFLASFWTRQRGKTVVWIKRAGGTQKAGVFGCPPFPGGGPWGGKQRGGGEKLGQTERITARGGKTPRWEKRGKKKCCEPRGRHVVRREKRATQRRVGGKTTVFLALPFLAAAKRREKKERRERSEKKER